MHIDYHPVRFYEEFIIITTALDRYRPLNFQYLIPDRMAVSLLQGIRFSS
jgi:hypothetical protein